MARIVLANGSGAVRFTSGNSSARFVDRVIDERDLSVGAARTLALTHFMSDPDVPLLPHAMRRAYSEMRAEHGDLPSPVLATYLGLERPSASDVIEIPSTST